METNHFSFFKQPNRWGLTILSAVLCLMLTPFFSAIMFIPRMPTFMPLALMMLLAFVGPISTVVCASIITGFFTFLLGPWGMLGALLFLLPVLIATAITCERNLNFWQSSILSSLIMLASEYTILAMVTMITKTDAISAIMNAFVSFFNQNSSLLDQLIDTMLQTGMIGTQSASPALLTSQDRLAIMQNMIQLMDAFLRREVPMQIATGAVSAGLLGQYLMRKGMSRKGEKISYPPLRTWAIPDGWGRIMLATVAVLYLLTLISNGTSAMFYVVTGVFEQVLALQGIACLCYVGHKRGHGRTWQVLIFFLGYFLLNVIVVVVGIVDQTFDFTHRRTEIKEWEEKMKRDAYDPRSNQ